MKKAELYEGACEIYHLLLPLLERHRDYTSLAEAHGDLQGQYSFDLFLFALCAFSFVR